MLPGRMLRPTTQDSTMPTWILQKPVLTVVVADGKVERTLHAVQEKTGRLARPVMVRIAGAAVGVLAIVGAFDETPSRLRS
jgi:hypothetical protein